MLAIAGIAIDVLSRPATVYRWDEPAWLDNGTYDPDANEAWLNGASKIAITACVQPPSAMRNIIELKAEPEAEHIDAEVVIYTRFALRTSDEILGTAADEIEQDGRRYRITVLSPRSEGVYTKAYGRLIGDRGRTV